MSEHDPRKPGEIFGDEETEPSDEDVFAREETEPQDEMATLRIGHQTRNVHVTDVSDAVRTTPREGVVASTPHEPHVVLDAVSSIAPPSHETRYQPGRLLGEGGMGAVSMARDRQIGRNVAIKVIKPEWVGDERTTARFVREARVQGQLEHPSIVPVYDLGVDATGALYFCMKRVRGTTLEEVIEGLRTGTPHIVAQYSTHRLLAAFAQVCLAIDFAHRRRVIHRDLKPANVMLGDYGEVYVLDWGLAKLMGEAPSIDEELVDVTLGTGSETAPGALLGTPGYMAPEQLRADHDEIGPEADVYALGAILFEILTLEELHPRGSAAEIVGSTLGGVDARPSVRAPDRAVAPELEAICVKATALARADRYRSPRQLHAAVEAYLEGARDVELRRQMSEEHAHRARESAVRAHGGDDEITNRRVAMREIGRALALDPESELAAQTLVDLLNTAPSALPDEVQIELRRSVAATNRQTGRLGAYAYLSLLFYLPLVLWLGLRDATFLVVIYVLAAMCTALSIWGARSKRTPTGVIVAVMLLSNVLFAATWPTFGPLVLLPTIIAANTASFAVHLDRGFRAFALLCGALAVLVPFGVELSGLVPSSYVFTEIGMSIRPQAVDLPELPTQIFLALTSVAAIVTGGLVVAGVRENLRATETRLYLYAWHLRELVPTTARAATDPTVARGGR
jgi:serine/threonine-protein kinase